jgi:preprotein translocase subunit YajC
MPTAAAAGGGGAATGGGMPVLLFQFGIITFLAYILFFRPQQQQDRKRREMVAALKKNDKVLTSAGIYGTVTLVDTDGDKVVLRVDDDKGVKLVFSKSSVLRVLEVAAEKPAESA